MAKWRNQDLNSHLSEQIAVPVRLHFVLFSLGYFKDYLPYFKRMKKNPLKKLKIV